MVGSEGPYPERVAYNEEKEKNLLSRLLVEKALWASCCLSAEKKHQVYRWGNNGIWSMGSVDTWPA